MKFVGSNAMHCEAVDEHLKTYSMHSVLSPSYLSRPKEPAVIRSLDRPYDPQEKGGKTL